MALICRPSSRCTMSEYGIKDRVLVNYNSRWYNIVNVPGIIIDVNPSKGWPFKISLQDEDGKPINLGHDDDGGEPGSGPIIYCSNKHLQLVEKYVPKRLEGTIKESWRVGDRFVPKKGFSMEQNDDDIYTGVTPTMVKCADQAMTVVAILPFDDIEWLVDGTNNYFWRKDWVDPIEE